MKKDLYILTVKNGGVGFVDEAKVVIFAAFYNFSVNFAVCSEGLSAAVNEHRQVITPITNCKRPPIHDIEPTEDDGEEEEGGISFRSTVHLMGGTTEKERLLPSSHSKHRKLLEKRQGPFCTRDALFFFLFFFKK